jgi:hypothetical protein
MDNIAEVTILLPEAEAKKWLLFQEYYDTFAILVEKGVFKQSNGVVSLHFDHNGSLQVIQRADVLFSRRHTKSYPQS